MLAAILSLSILSSAIFAAPAVEVGGAMRARIEAEWMTADARFAPATGKPTAKPSEHGVTTAEDASGAVDGVKNGRWGFHVASGESDPWWQVDLGKVTPLDRIVVYNRADGNTAARTRGLLISVAGDDGDPACKTFRLIHDQKGKVFYGVTEKKPLVVDLKGKGVKARIVRLHVKGKLSFALDEIEVYAADAPSKNVALGKPADQKSVSPYSFPGTLPDGVIKAAPPRKAPQGGGFTFAHTRQVIDRARKLAARLSDSADPKRLGPAVAQLDRLEQEITRLENNKKLTAEARKKLYLDARRLARRIAFCNPLLDMDRLLFITRHDAGGPFHMCDQYYGCNAKPGGGLYVLSQPFGAEPKLRSLLADAVVEKGRLKGKKLAGGSFLSPELSFDGKTLYFAYSECGAKKTYTWGPTISYHIFRCNADGTGLVQLTDGDADDFDPCELPNGRIAFISLRRGGYLRCGRHCPVYTTFSMEPDGSDIVCLSYHETHEWHPSVTNDGMLVYSRWDYVDRDTNIAHHIWTSYPDGRDPRSFHGNYPVNRESRPWMEMSIRAVPGSHKFVAVTGAHHGHAFGSLVLIDPRVGDDNAMSQLERLTPDTPFAESEGGRGNIRKFMRYGTPWPLTEDDYLCVYDEQARNRGIYWIDRTGNRELLYRDASVPCLSPIPLRPRTRPPVIPDATTQTARTKGDGAATLAVVNVYDSDFEWPEGTAIKALRVIQLLPKSTAPPNKPRIGVANQTNARAVLGTVPVEADGSVYFEAPVGKALYFQAIDAHGMAIMSMRSATYVHPGERLTCQGCHERKHSQTPPTTRVPLAMRRAPSKVVPDVGGSNPFTYPRLVQPALDRGCVACHREKKALDLSGALAGNFTRSYNNLAAKYGFYFHVTNGSINQGVHGGSRTIPGKFGARAAKLLPYLDKRHHGVKLSPEDFHRITLWLDCNSEFYGAYENTAAQARGEVVQPSLH